MTAMSPEFIQKLRAVRKGVTQKHWLFLAERFRMESGPPTSSTAADLAQIAFPPNASWALRQAFKEEGVSSWTELATAFEVVDAWVVSSPTAIDIVWTGPANGTFPIRRIDQVLYDLISDARQRIFLVTFSAHRVPLLCEHLSKAIDRGVQVTLLLESAQSSAGQLSHDAAKAFKDVDLRKVRLLHWPLEKRERNQAGKPGKLHVKCAVVDYVAMIGSANLTDDAFNRNMEMGVIIRQPETVDAIIEHFDALQSAGEIEQFS
jgi:cardiolipin synthase